MDEHVVAFFEKVHQVLQHIHEMVPGAGEIGGMLGSMKEELDHIKGGAEKQPDKKK